MECEYISCCCLHRFLNQPKIWLTEFNARTWALIESLETSKTQVPLFFYGLLPLSRGNKKVWRYNRLFNLLKIRLTVLDTFNLEQFCLNHAVTWTIEFISLSPCVFKKKKKKKRETQAACKSRRFNSSRGCGENIGVVVISVVGKVRVLGLELDFLKTLHW